MPVLEIPSPPTGRLDLEYRQALAETPPIRSALAQSLRQKPDIGKRHQRLCGLLRFPDCRIDIGAIDESDQFLWSAVRYEL